MASEPWPTVFGDAFELENVIDLLTEFTKIPETVSRAVIEETLRPNSALPVLETRIRALLMWSGIGHNCFDDEGRVWPAVPVNTLQDAAIAVYRFAHRAQTPGDVMECLPDLTVALWKLHAIIRDGESLDAELRRDAKRESVRTAQRVRLKNVNVEHERWREEAERVRRDHPAVAGNKSEIARMVIRRLELDVTERAVTPHI